MLGSFHVIVAPQDFIDAFQDTVAGRADLQGVVTPALNWKASFPQQQQQERRWRPSSLSRQPEKVIKCN